MVQANEKHVVALATIYLHTDAVRNGSIDAYTPPDLLAAARHLGAARIEAVGNYFRRVAIEELRVISATSSAPMLVEALNLLFPDDPGTSTCEWESTEDPTDEEDLSYPGARRIGFAFRVRRPLDQALCAILDPQAWDDYSGFMKKAQCVDAATVATTPLQADVPEMGAPPLKGSDWNLGGKVPPLYEHFEVPAALGAWQFMQIFKVTPKTPPPTYSFAYTLSDCRWSVLATVGAKGGTVRNQGDLTATEQNSAGQTWTVIAVNKSLLIKRDDWLPSQNAWMTLVSAAMLKAGWRGQLVGAVINCP